VVVVAAVQLVAVVLVGIYRVLVIQYHQDKHIRSS
jgi:hypothetical protein